MAFFLPLINININLILRREVSVASCRAIVNKFNPSTFAWDPQGPLPHALLCPASPSSPFATF